MAPNPQFHLKRLDFRCGVAPKFPLPSIRLEVESVKQYIRTTFDTGAEHSSRLYSWGSRPTRISTAGPATAQISVFSQ
ncbi:hypothetical protein SCA6_008506 [Theobroma cacao]